MRSFRCCDSSNRVNCATDSASSRWRQSLLRHRLMNVIVHVAFRQLLLRIEVVRGEAARRGRSAAALHAAVAGAVRKGDDPPLHQPEFEAGPRLFWQGLLPEEVREAPQEREGTRPPPQAGGGPAMRVP